MEFKLRLRLNRRVGGAEHYSYKLYISRGTNIRGHTRAREVWYRECQLERDNIQ